MTDRLRAALADRYRIERELGQGGMATVYLAHDIKHDRKVALKVLKPELAAVIGAERFVVEIRTTAALQHPNILPLFDSGEADSFLYYVMPFIDGETLRAKLDRETQLGVEEAVQLTRDVADALHYAHTHGVIHRDIKPENILLANGRPMVADFGIALALSAAAGGRMTETGLSLGTPHYMSPEQATAEKEITARSDVYSLASVLFEMLTGDPPHTGASAQQIIMKIVTEEAPSVSKLRKSVPPNVAAVVSKALEKLPADRFDSAKAFAEALNNPAFITSAATQLHAGSGKRTQTFGTWIRNPWSWGALLATAAAIVFVSVSDGGGQHISFTQKTFRPEAIYTTRFAPDGQTIVFSSTGKTGTVPHLFIIRPDGPEPQPLGPDSTHLLSISSTGQIAVLTGAQYVEHRVFRGMLSTLPLSGGAPRQMLANVRDADWSPDGTTLAVIRTLDGVDRLEYPIGTVLYKAGGYLSDLRVSPTGDAVAFLEHPVQWDDRGEVVIVDNTGRTIAKSATYWAVEGVAWHADGQRVFYSAAAAEASYTAMTIFAMNRRGGVQQVAASAGGLTVQDVSAARRLLVTQDMKSYRVLFHDSAGLEDRDLGWLDGAANPVVSGDGKFLAFTDQSSTGGNLYTSLLRKTDGSPAVRLGTGGTLALSRDGKSLLSYVLSTPARLMLYPTGPGESKRLDEAQFQSLLYSSGAFFGDGKRFFVCGNLPKEGTRCFVGALGGGAIVPVTPEGTTQAALSRDDNTIVAQVADSFALFSVDGGASRPALGFVSGDKLDRWSPDGREVWVYQTGPLRMRADRVDPRSGRRTTLTEISPTDRVGWRRAGELRFADDPRVYAYSQIRYTSALFVLEGLR